MTPIELAWAAGFWEGEGSVQIAKSVNYSLQVNVTNTKLPPLNLYQQEWGGNLREHAQPTTTHARSFQWIVTNWNAARFLKAIRPYLVYRHEQVNTGLALMKGMRRRDGPGPHYGKGNSMSADEIAYRYSLYLRMRALNKRGPKGDVPDMPKLLSAQTPLWSETEATT